VRSPDHLHSAAELLRKLKARLATVNDRAIVAEVLELLRQHEASAPPAALDAWCRVHGGNWQPSARDTAVMRYLLACGQAQRDEVARLIGTPEQPASNEAVRKYFCDLRLRLERADATATVLPAKRDGVYRTHDSTIQTLCMKQETPARLVFRIGHR